MQVTHDYRKWLAFNSSIHTQQNIDSLFDAVANAKTTRTFILDEQTDESGSRHYLIRSSNDDVSLILPVSNRETFLNYLREHYFSSEHVSTQNVSDPFFDSGTNAFASAMFLEEDLRGGFAKTTSKYLPNINIKLHALGFALLGFIVSQIAVIPSNVFHVKLPEATAWILALSFGILGHFAVRSYKKHFLTNGIRYNTVWRIIFWLYSITFLAIGVEISFIDWLQDDSNYLALFFMPVIIMLAGLLSGWICSFFIYFFNGGKVVTDPQAVAEARKN